MEEIMKRVETWKVGTEQEAEALIKKAKEDPDKEGYELKGYKMTKKEKKSKGEVIDITFEVQLTKVW